MKKHDESKLPKWAQLTIKGLRWDIDILKREKDTLEKANCVLDEKEWFIIPNNNDEPFSLFILQNNSANCVCSIGPNDTLLVGRAKK